MDNETYVYFYTCKNARIRDALHRYLAHNFGEKIEVGDTKMLFDEFTKVGLNGVKHPYAEEIKSMFYRESGGTYTNPAAAADITRAVLMYEIGGIYMDVDVILCKKLTAPSNGFLDSIVIIYEAKKPYNRFVQQREKKKDFLHSE